MGRTVVLVSSHSTPQTMPDFGSPSSAPDTELFAVDPIAYVQLKGVRPKVSKLVGLLTPDSLAGIDQATQARVSSYVDLAVRETLTGLNLGRLEARSIFFRLIAFEKSLAVANAVMTDAHSIELVGDSAAEAGAPFPSEFEDLFVIVKRLADARGVGCHRFSGPTGSFARKRPRQRIARAVVQTLYWLRARRPGRVLTVDLYGDLRERLSDLLPSSTLLPLVGGRGPSAQDRAEAANLASEFAQAVRGTTRGEPADAFQEIRVDCLRDALLKDLPSLLARARDTRRALSRFRPHAVLMMEDASPAGRSVAALSRSSGAWTAVIQHGLTGEDLAGTHVMPSVAHVQFAWGDISSEWSRAHGAPPDSQLVVGNPMFDGYFTHGGLTTEGPPPNQVVYASQPVVGVSAQETEFDRLQVLEALFPLEREGIPVVVKAHPSEGIAGLRELVHTVGFRHALWDSTLSETLSRPAVFVTRSSTVALEAMILSKPVVLAVLSGRGDVTGLSGEGAALVAESPDMLTDLVRSCLHDETVRRRLGEGRKALLPRYLDGMDGGAARRVALELSLHLASLGAGR